MQTRQKKQKITADYTGVLLGMGNPLLDISANVDDDFLNKYGVTMNNAILAEEKHIPIYEELISKHKPIYIAGGATQNSIRVAQWMLQEKGATSFIGSVGKDDAGKKLAACAKKDGVAVHYHQDTEKPTGKCACLIKDQERSLVTHLEAANNYKISHAQSAKIQGVIKKAKFYYIAGFFLTVSPETIMHVAQHSHENKKTFCMNLSAPFICQFFKGPQSEAMPYVDIIVGNESEAEAYGKANELKDCSPKAVAIHLANLPKKNPDFPRIAIITQGPQETFVAIKDTVTSYKVPKIPKEEIVDSNGAGDAFVGGFLAYYIKGHPMEECIAAGNYAAGVILRVSGTVLSGKPAPQSEWAKA